MLKSGTKRALRKLGLNRQRVAAARMYAERVTLAAVPRKKPQRKGGRILCYHSIGQPQTGVNDVSPERFARHLDLARELGYRFVPAREIAETGGQPMDLALTFDDAWTSVAEQAAPIIRKRDLPWSLFIVSRWSAHEFDWTRDVILNWDDLASLSGSDVEYGSHSLTHPDFGKLERDEIRDQLFSSRETIADKLGSAPPTFAIPLGQSMNWTAEAHELAKQAGYEVVYAQAEETRFPGTAPRTFVTHFDNDMIFRALLDGAFDRWEEWV